MAGKPQKLASLRIDQRPQRARSGTSAVVRDTSRPIPIPPVGLRKSAKDAWLAFWRSPMATLVQDESDMDALRDWAFCISERDRIQPLVRKTPLVPGSMGQMVLNPLAALVKDYTRRIDRYREQFGMTPLSRMRLGIAVGEAHDVLSDLAASLGPDEAEVVVLDDDGVIEVSS